MSTEKSRPRRVHSGLRKVLVGVGVVAMLLCIGWCAKSFTDRWRGTTITTSLSPDDRYIARAVDRAALYGIFTVRELFIEIGPRESPEAHYVRLAAVQYGGPLGSERFIWSKNSDYAMLVGRHFEHHHPIVLKTGETAFALWHLPTRTVWCNEVFGENVLDTAIIATIEFPEPLIVTK